MQEMYSVGFAGKADSLADDMFSFTITPIGTQNGKITGIRVQDLARHIWFNWNDPPRSWDSAPSCTAGVGKLYVAFYATNVGNMPGNLTLSLIETLSGRVLGTVVAHASPGEGVGIEWTGDMPAGNYDLTCQATP